MAMLNNWRYIYIYTYKNTHTHIRTVYVIYIYTSIYIHVGTSKETKLAPTYSTTCIYFILLYDFQVVIAICRFLNGL